MNDNVIEGPIAEIELVNGGTFMVHLNYGYCLGDEGCHTFGEDTRAAIRKTMKMVKVCNCKECKENAK